MRKGSKMNITDAIAVLEKERADRGLGMLELLIDIRENRVDYETNTKAILILASDKFCELGREFFADVDDEEFV
jgi:hypothetical protein